MRDVTRLTRLEEQLEDSHTYRNIIGKSARMREIFQLISDLAETDSTVLVIGESGTGKELVAAALHNASTRADGPFLRVNCAALSEDILESELFGHVKGAFTGAVRDRIGRFEAAHGGTILLDEIGDVSPRLQLRLLRVLQEREFERVGDTTPIRTDVRVIASTNQNLEQLIATGEFRQDLYYRLNVVRMEVPPLRQRREDIPLLVDYFCGRFNRSLKKEITGVAPETMEILMRYPWPGNVRELENCIERAFIVCHDAVILPRHIPPEVAQHDTHKHPVAATPAGIPEPGDGRGARGSALLDRDRIVETLLQTDWNVAKSARLLGVARNTLYQRMRSLDIQRPPAS
jgi:transcriptional regulator with GAF, ATPase, and Fis domain